MVLEFDPANVKQRQIGQNPSGGTTSSATVSINKLNTTSNFEDGKAYSNAANSTNPTVYIRFGRTSAGLAYYQYSTSSGEFPSSVPSNTAVDSIIPGNGSGASGTVFYNEQTALILYAGTPLTDGTGVETSGSYDVMIEGGSTLAGKVTLVTAQNRDIIFNLYKGDILYDGMRRQSTTGTNANFAAATDIKYDADGKGLGGERFGLRCKRESKSKCRQPI